MCYAGEPTRAVSGERCRNRAEVFTAYRTQILDGNRRRDTFAEYQSLSESLCLSSSNRFLRWLEQQPFCRECKPVKKKEKNNVRGKKRTNLSNSG